MVRWAQPIGDKVLSARGVSSSRHDASRGSRRREFNLARWITRERSTTGSSLELLPSRSYRRPAPFQWRPRFRTGGLTLTQISV